MVQEFYAHLFSSKPIFSSDAILDSIPTKVTDEMNADLTKPYSDDEIKHALFQMGPTKAPGPDGFPALFYQTHWDFFQEDICRAVRTFLDGGQLPEGFCDSVVVLIPKITNPQHLKNFRPISLCNVLYKIASKVLANRLKLLLPMIISENQSAFVPGRLITDNALIAHECLHTIRQQHAKRPFFALKVDMMKAYDRVEWNYLSGCLQKLGFSQSWINTVMRCVTTVRYAVRVNGDLTQPVIPTRGIRQGDPISPISFFYVRKDYPVYCNKGRLKVYYKVYVTVDLAPQSPIYCLQMTAFSLLVRMRGVLMLCGRPCIPSVRDLAKRSTWINHQSSLAPTVLR